MKAIYKYHFHSLSGYVTLNIPLSAKLLSVGKQKDNIVAWFEVDVTDTDSGYHVFYVALTGETIEDEMEYINTILFDDGDYVVHVYKVNE